MKKRARVDNPGKLRRLLSSCRDDPLSPWTKAKSRNRDFCGRWSGREYSLTRRNAVGAGKSDRPSTRPLFGVLRYRSKGLHDDSGTGVIPLGFVLAGYVGRFRKNGTFSMPLWIVPFTPIRVLNTFKASESRKSQRAIRRIHRTRKKLED